MTDTINLLFAKSVIKHYYPSARYGIFSSRNLCGDEMKTLYVDSHICIDICKEWEYFEVFGLTEEEFLELRHFYWELVNKK